MLRPLVITGNTFLAEEVLQERALSYPRLSREEVKPAIITPLLAPTLFGDAGLIVDLQGVKTDKALMQLLLSASVPVVILDPEPTATRRKQYEQAEVIELPHPTKPREVLSWLLSYTKKHKIALETPAAQYLCDVFANDLASIVSELNKLNLIEPPYTRERVAQLVGKEPLGDSFVMLEAITTGKTEKALHEYRRLMNQGEEAFRLMGVIVWQYTLIARCVAYLAQGLPVAEAPKRLGTKPYPTQKAMQIAQRLDEVSVTTQLQFIFQAEQALKTGRDPVYTMERLLIQLSSNRENLNH